MISWMIRPPCEVTDQLAVGTQNCFSTLFYTPYTNVKTSAQNAPKCTIARQKNQKIFWGGGTARGLCRLPRNFFPRPLPTGERDTPSPGPTPSVPLAPRPAFPFLFIYDSNTAYMTYVLDTDNQTVWNDLQRSLKVIGSFIVFWIFLTFYKKLEM